MNTKLTLSIDATIIDAAKRYLQTKHSSLSALTEEYFKVLIATRTQQAANTPIVEELTGIAKVAKDVDEKTIITEYLLEKYK